MATTMAQLRTARRRGQQVIIWGIGLVVTAVMLGLGLWQMQSFRDTGREALIARMHEPAVDLTSVAPAGQEPGDAYGRTVRAAGSYLPEQQLLIPQPDGGFRVLTALQLADGSVVGVVRGVAASDQPPAPPSGEVIQVGVFLPSEAESQLPPPAGQLGSVRLPRLAQLWPQPLVPGFIMLEDSAATAQDLTAAEVTLPSNAGHARNQGYALQWWIFAGAAVAATVKLSRDAAKGTGLMSAGQNLRAAPSDTVVDDSVDDRGESARPSTGNPGETSGARQLAPTTVDRDQETER